VGNESIKHLKQGVRGGAEEMDRADQLKTDSEKRSWVFSLENTRQLKSSKPKKSLGAGCEVT
jgi:hypothetical protein